MGNTALIKKILNVGLIVGGLMMLVGGIIAVINVFSIEKFEEIEDFNVMFGWAIVTRIGAIICFVLSLALVGYAFLFRESNKIPAYVTVVAGVLGFVGQFLFNPVTSIGAMTNAIWSHRGSLLSSYSSDKVLGIIQGPSATGLIFAIVAGIVMLAVGIMGLVKKSLPFIPYNSQPVNNQYGQPMNNQYGQPMNNQYAQPVNSQYAQPANNQYAQPMNNQYAQPMNNQYAQPMNNQYAQPMNNQYSQPINNDQYTQPTNVNPYGTPTNNPYEQQPTNNNPYDNNNYNG